eukprot:scaffold381688_cov19-Prasinocladus_malaysianus.AAC.1
MPVKHKQPTLNTKYGDNFKCITNATITNASFKANTDSQNAKLRDVQENCRPAPKHQNAAVELSCKDKPETIILKGVTLDRISADA